MLIKFLKNAIKAKKLKIEKRKKIVALKNKIFLLQEEVVAIKESILNGNYGAYTNLLVKEAELEVEVKYLTEALKGE